MTQKTILLQLKQRQPLFFREVKNFSGSIKMHIYKNYLIVKFKKQLNNTVLDDAVYKNYDIYQIINDSLKYIDTTSDKAYIHNLINKGA